MTPPQSGEQHPAPLVVGGTGGSGTRVVARILMHSGRYMGENRNQAEDALEFAPFDYHWAPAYLAARTRGVELSDDQLGAMKTDFSAARDRHRAPMDDPTAPWGWKHSPSVHLLPFLNQIYPTFRFIHVIRDARDFAFARTGGHVHALKLAHAVLDADPTPALARNRSRDTELTPARKARFWARVHVDCADFGETRLGDRYLRVRFEDLCSRPDQALRTLLAFAGADAAEPDRIRSEIRPPGSIGSWRQRNPAEVMPVVAAASSALARFGYVHEP